MKDIYFKIDLRLSLSCQDLPWVLHVEVLSKDQLRSHVDRLRLHFIMFKNTGTESEFLPEKGGGGFYF